MDNAIEKFLAAAKGIGIDPNAGNYPVAFVTPGNSHLLGEEGHRIGVPVPMTTEEWAERWRQPVADPHHQPAPPPGIPRVTPTSEPGIFLRAPGRDPAAEIEREDPNDTGR